jgi:excisionase family DNA binding protein
MSEFLRPEEAGKVLGVRRTRAYQLIRLGVIPSVQIGGAIRVPKQAFEEWLAAANKAAAKRAQALARIHAKCVDLALEESN